jgi:hypothetical protein
MLYCKHSFPLMTTAFHASPLRRVSRALSILFLAMPLAQAADVSDLVNRNWIDIDSPNFRVVTDQPEDVARHMIVDLENLRYISNRVRGAQSLDGPPLTIVACEVRHPLLQFESRIAQATRALPAPA